MSASRIPARRAGAAVLSALAATVLCAGCTSSSKGTPVPVRPTTAASSTSSIPSSALPSLSGLPTGVGGKDPFCTELNSGDLTGLANTGSYQKVVAVWDKLAADAPDSIKSDVQAIDKYLNDVIAGKLSATDSQAIATSAGHIGAWVATHCAQAQVEMDRARNALGGELDECGTEPLTGFFRDGCCNTSPDDVGSHTVCAVATREFLEHQVAVGNDLSTPMPNYGFPGLRPGDRWCVVAVRWLQAYHDGVAPPVVLAATHEHATDLIPLEILRQFAVDVPADPGELG